MENPEPDPKVSTLHVNFSCLPVQSNNQPGRTLPDMSTLRLLCNAQTQSCQELGLGGAGQHSHPAAGNSAENFLQCTKYPHERKVSNPLALQTTRQYFLILQPHSIRTPEHFSYHAKPLCSFGNECSFRHAFTRLTQSEQVLFLFVCSKQYKRYNVRIPNNFHNNENPHLNSVTITNWELRIFYKRRNLSSPQNSQNTILMKEKTNS